VSLPTSFNLDLTYNSNSSCSNLHCTKLGANNRNNSSFFCGDCKCTPTRACLQLCELSTFSYLYLTLFLLLIQFDPISSLHNTKKTSSPTNSSGNQPSGSNTQNTITIVVNNGSGSSTK
jgi:hypothetical protein